MNFSVPEAGLRVFDGHNDLRYALRFLRGDSVEDVDRGLPDLFTDIPRLRAGQVGGQFWSVFVPTELAPAAAVQLARWHEAHPAPEVTVAEVVAHLQHARDLVGIDHLGLGGDYDGVPAMPAALHDVSTYPVLLTALSDAGWSTSDLDALTWTNTTRVLAEAERVEAKLTRHH